MTTTTTGARLIGLIGLISALALAGTACGRSRERALATGALFRKGRGLVLRSATPLSPAGQRSLRRRAFRPEAGDQALQIAEQLDRYAVPPHDHALL